MDPLLCGHNPEERIVAVQQLNDQTVRLFRRIKGKILHKDVEFFPFFFLADDDFIRGFPKQFWLKELEGSNYYRYIAAFSRWGEMWEAVHYILSQYNKRHSERISAYQELKEILIRTDPVRQYLLQSGITLFKGMKFDELVCLYLDIQFAPIATGRRGGKKQSERILNISIMTNDGTVTVLTDTKHNERSILEKFIARVNKIDPDVIEGYDIFGSILPAISRACEREEIRLAIGRDGSDMRGPAGFGGAGFGETEWFSYEVFGRHLVDTLALADFDSGMKKTDQTINLYLLAKQSGIEVDKSRMIPRHRLAEIWEQSPERVIEHSGQNVHITRQISDAFFPMIFNLAQLCPFSLKMLIHSGASARIESLILREYVHRKHSIPKPAEGGRNINIPAEIFQTGIFPDVVYAGLEGIYSSIILNEEIGPGPDRLNVFQKVLKSINALRREISEKVQSENSQISDLQSQLSALKYLNDSFHIYLGWSKGLFSDPEATEKVVIKIKEILKEIARQAELFNAAVIHLDAQGMLIIMPDNIIGEENRKIFFNRLSENLPDGILLEPSRYYRKMLAYRKGNYALLDQNNNVFIKGNGLISRGMENFLRIFTLRFIECLLTSDLKRLHHTYASAYTQITEHKWTAADFARTDLARLDIETYQSETASGKIAPSPAMEAAIRSSIFIKPNAKISYYITGTEADADLTRSSRLAEEWNPSLPDENIAYYLGKLKETAHKFKEFFEPTAFDRIVSLDEIFGFTDEGIRILSRKAASEGAETRSGAEDYGIWLAETE